MSIIDYIGSLGICIEILAASCIAYHVQKQINSLEKAIKIEVERTHPPPERPSEFLLDLFKWEKRGFVGLAVGLLMQLIGTL